MAEKMKHTPLPWRRSNGQLVRIFPVGSDVVVAGCHKIGKFNGENHGAAEANAALIVRAVNSHEALVEALTMARAAVARCCGAHEPLWSTNEALAKIDAALKLAESP